MKCWNCGTEHEDTASNDAYDRGYKSGYADAEKYYTNSCFYCGYAGEWSTWACDDCLKEKNEGSEI